MWHGPSRNSKQADQPAEHSCRGISCDKFERRSVPFEALRVRKGGTAVKEAEVSVPAVSQQPLKSVRWLFPMTVVF